jgi:hypothetical protein
MFRGTAPAHPEWRLKGERIGPETDDVHTVDNENYSTRPKQHETTAKR